MRQRLGRYLLIAILAAHAVFPSGVQAAGRQEKFSPEAALIPIQGSYPEFHDDLDFDRLGVAIRRNIGYLKRLDPGQEFTYGPHRFASRHVLESQEAFLGLISRRPPLTQLNRMLREQFRLYRATGQAETRKVVFTGYYEPVFEAGLSPTPVFRYPIYGPPEDLVPIDLSIFDEKFKGERIIARIQNNRVVPYYTRRQIETERALAGKTLEIAWLKDPIDAYLLHIEGAGRLILPDGATLYVNYAASNGRPYRSFGRYLLEKGYVTAGQLSIEKIREFFSARPEILDEVLHHNDAYTFFKGSQHGPLGNINVPLTMGRSLALDDRLFPKGALAFMTCRKPLLDGRGGVTGWTDFSRFVLNQDTGAAIQGPGRADLFWGSGPHAEAAAWRLKHDGDLFVLIKNPVD